MTEIRTTIKGGLPVIAKGVHVPYVPARLHGDYPQPAEGGHCEDIGLYWLSGKECHLPLSDADCERIDAELCEASTEGWEL